MGLARIDQVKYTKWILPIVEIIAHIIQALKRRPKLQAPHKIMFINFVQTVQNMYGKGGQRVCKAELRPPEVDPYFERKKITLGGVTKSWGVTILTLEQNPPERKFLTYIKIFSQEDFALKSKL